MAQQTAACEQRVEQPAKPRGRPWPPGVSGNPAGARVMSKRAAELFDAILADLGDLTAVDRALLGQACSLMVRSERVKDADDAVRLANAAARLLTNLRKGNKREPAGPSLSEYLAKKAVEGTGS